MSKPEQVQTSNFDEQRKEIFKNRALAVAYLNITNRSDGLLTEAHASVGNHLSIDQGNVSSGLGTASEVVGTFSSIAGAFISAAAKIAGFFHTKDIKETHKNTLDVAGDATPDDWSKFTRELAAQITLENQDYLMEGIHLDNSVEPHRKSALSKEDREKIEKKSKGLFAKVLTAINSDSIEINPELGIADKNSRKELIEQLSSAARTLSKEELVKEATNDKEKDQNNHQVFGKFTEEVVNHSHGHTQPHSAKSSVAAH